MCYENLILVVFYVRCWIKYDLNMEASNHKQYKQKYFKIVFEFSRIKIHRIISKLMSKKLLVIMLLYFTPVNYTHKYKHDNNDIHKLNFSVVWVVHMGF
jgi:hypothetical protein